MKFFQKPVSEESERVPPGQHLQKRNYTKHVGDMDFCQITKNLDV